MGGPARVCEVGGGGWFSLLSAELRAADIEERALRQAEEVRREAEAYAYRVLEKLREQIGQVAQTVDRGLQELDARGARATRPSGAST